MDRNETKSIITAYIVQSVRQDDDNHRVSSVYRPRAESFVHLEGGGNSHLFQSPSIQSDQ